MKVILFCLSLLAFTLAHAEDKVCQVTGMTCSSCVDMVKAKVCATGSYGTCEAKLVNVKKELGELHVSTKDAGGKVDEKTLKAAVKDAGYTLGKCTGGKG